MRVLLVEDEPALRMTMAANLELEGLEVVEAESAEVALGLVAQQAFDIVLSDVRMPGMGGVALCQRLRRDAPTLPVVLMTAFALEEHVRHAIEGGVYTVLSKPVNPDRIVPLLTRASKRPVVLVIDRTVHDAVATARALEAGGLRARAVEHTDEVVQALGDGQVDVCIADLDRPRAQELIERIVELASDVSVIAVAGEDDPVVIARLANLVHTFVRRPFAVQDLVHLVAKARRAGAGGR